MDLDPETPASRRQALNGDLAERAFQKGSGHAIHRPVHVYLQIASACNLDCYMCTEHNRPPHLRRGHGLRSLSPEIFEKIEREVLPWSTRLSFGVGGEPTISEHFAEYVARGARLGQEIHLTTNGTRLDREDIADVVARHVQRVQVSIDAATPATYERIRIGARWTVLRRGLELLQRKRVELGTQSRCHVSLFFVLMRSNVDELPAFVDLAHEVGADAVWAQHVIPATEDARDEPLITEPERYNRVLRLARERSIALGMPLNAPLPYPIAGAPTERAFDAPPPARSERLVAALEHAIPCRFPTQALFVLYDGRVFPCCHPFAHQKMQVGDLSKESFARIWNGIVYRNLRKGLHDGDAPRICASCSLAHDPPPVYEDPAVLLAGPSLTEFYAERDLEPQNGLDPLAWMIQSGWMDWADDMQKHTRALSDERAHMSGHIANIEQRIESLETSRDDWSTHARTLADERVHLLGHIANLERERDELRSSAANLRGVVGPFRFVGRALTGPWVRNTFLPRASPPTEVSTEHV